MKKIIFLIVLAIIGIGAFFIFQKTAPSEPTPPTEKVGKCGDNVCDDFERANLNLCPKDCSSTQSSQPPQASSEQPLVVTKSNDQMSGDSPFGALPSFSFSKSLRSKDQSPKPDFDFKPTKDLGLKWGRSLDLIWPAVQPAKDSIDKGIYNWSGSDSVLSSYPEGFNVLENIMAFAAQKDEKGERLGEHLENFSFSSKNDEESYARFVEKAAERYDGDGKDDMPGLKSPIKYWQVENEPDFKTKDWKGYSNLLKVTYEAIKSSCPDCKVITGGIGGEVVGLTEFFKPALLKLGLKYFDIFDYHCFGSKNDWKKCGNLVEEIRKNFPNSNLEIWLTETGTWSGKPSSPPPHLTSQSEKEQAGAIVKYYVYVLSKGVKKIFWAWGILEGFGGEENNIFDNTGLIYDGYGPNDLGFGIKKLSYYTYKKMVEVLEGSDWDNIQTIQEKDGIYVYKFIKNGKSIWVAWNENSGEKQITISGIDSSLIKVTEAVPNYSSGKEVTNYNTAFKTEAKQTINGKLTITLGKTPVFIEGN